MIRHCTTYHDIKDRFLPSGKRICLNQGGTRSGKTFSTMQFLIEVAITGAERNMEGLLFSVTRKTFPALRGSAYRDFVKILNKLGRYNIKDHDRSNHEYKLGNSLFEFFSVDQPMKQRGRERDVIFVNEMNELSLEDWRQLLFRTKSKVIGDFNPSDEFHWIYEEAMTRDDCMTFVTTYLDNPHLPKEQVDEIERYKLVDENYWKIFGLGQRGVSGSTIFTNWSLVDSIPEGGNKAIGIDFGYNNPTAVMLCSKRDEGLYVDELLYKSHMTNNDLIAELKLLNIGRTVLKCDNAEPDRIAELVRAGFNAQPAKKEVKVGIDKMKSVPIFITKRSTSTHKEFKSYKWKIDAVGHTIDEPVKINDHACDGTRYAAYDLILDRKIIAPRFNFN